MEQDLIVQAVQLAVKKWPGILPYLSRKARHLIGDFELKTYEYYLHTIRGMVMGVYLGYLGGEFEGMMDNLILGQLSDAYETAMKDNDLLPEEATEEMRAQLQGFVEAERGYVRGLFEDIIDARVDKTPIDPLLARAELWANRYNEVYNAAVLTIKSLKGEKLKWVFGETEEHCATCAALAAFGAAYAADWEYANIHPGSHELACGGWRCDCRLEPTTERRRPNAAQRIRDIVDNTRLGQ